MNTFRAGDREVTRRLLRRVEHGENDALGELFARYEARLLTMVELRMDRRVRGRVDARDVLQEAYIEVMKSVSTFDSRGAGSFYLWLRSITVRKLIRVHRFHLAAQGRDVRREVRFCHGAMPFATSETLAARLLGRSTTPSQAAMRAEREAKLKEALDTMRPADREIIALRHFEHLSSAEAAVVLHIEEPAARKRHLRAMLALKELLKSLEPQ